MGLFADIQAAVAEEKRQARLRSEQPLPTPFPTPQATTPPAPAPAPTPTHTPIPTPVPPQIAAAQDGNVAAIQRIKREVERITRRGMKDAVADYLAQSCNTNPDLACAVMQDTKSMVKCFGYINRKAREYAEQERKDTGNTDSTYGCDVPDDLVYQWAVDYYLDPNADKEPERKTPPKPAAKGKAAKKQDTSPDGEQMTLMEATT